MEEAIASALAVVLRDLNATSTVMPQIEDRQWSSFPGQIAAFLQDPKFSHGRGISVMINESKVEQIVSLADQLQEWVVEALWLRGISAVWPQCPAHPDSHPLRATIMDNRAVWMCPTLEGVVAEVGSLDHGGSPCSSSK
jgi:hypothetical protein